MKAIVGDESEIFELRREFLEFRALIGQWCRLRSEIKAGFRINQLRDLLGRWALEGSVQQTTSDGFLTGIQEIDETSEALSDCLAGVMNAVEYLPTMSPSNYGVAVHMAFGAAVRALNLPGVGDIERSFSLDNFNPRYGLRDTIRTDVTLRNIQGDIIAIYDVKTGDDPVSPARAEELRLMTRAAPGTPVFELNIVRGISRKCLLCRLI
ncbi:hypothetical protein IP86_19190 [Rhodopseudomonas sp. AAP120]|uniref:hypothetical protein n=1 Tax=Rhodopseudomonas sp. AAP120 TaxID=1523430 RepID=UPI0006B95778|nr:hypothetical protein [Rhodopseudomonas sp. AAP120]KPF95394.1 hypothetical protein IP86_19190 [Rhodopseudomonas sp. AAP120]